MPKFTVKKGDEEIEVELTDEEILNKLNLQEPNIFAKVLDKIGLRKKETEKPKSKEKNEETPGDTVLSNEIKELRETFTEGMTAVKEAMKVFTETQKEKEKETTEQKANSSVEKAVQDGRIAKGEVETLKKKFAEKYNSDVEILNDVLSSRQPDEKIKTENQKTAESGASESHGTPSFKREQLADIKFYEKHREEIQKAQEAGTIID